MNESHRAVLDSVFARPAYRWQAPPDPFRLLRHGWQTLERWLYELSTNNPVGYRALIWALLLVLAGIVLHALWTAFRTFRMTDRGGPVAARGPQRDARWHRAEARRLAVAGRWAEAAQADFAGLVLELDTRGAVRFMPGKTPREYAREAGLGTGRAAFADLVRRLYAASFARLPFGPDEYAAWQRDTSPDRYAPVR